MPGYRALELTVPELHDLRMICSLEMVTSGWDTNTVPCSLDTENSCHSRSFEILQAEVNESFRPAHVR